MGMQINDHLRTMSMEHGYHALDRLPAEGNIIQIQPVDLLIFSQPIQPFHIIVGPAGGPFVEHRSVINTVGVPGRVIMILQMQVKAANGLPDKRLCLSM